MPRMSMRALFYPRRHRSASSFGEASLEAGATIYWRNAGRICSSGKLTRDKLAISDQLFPDLSVPLHGRPKRKKKETVRIDLPPAIAEEPPDQDIKPRETVRIQLPVREPPSIS